MGYIIHYQPESDTRYPPVRKGKKITAAAVGKLTGILLVLVCLIWGGQILDFLLPGDPEVTKGALGSMVEELENGTPVGEAVNTFCMEILNGSKG